MSEKRRIPIEKFNCSTLCWLIRKIQTNEWITLTERLVRSLFEQAYSLHINEKQKEYVCECVVCEYETSTAVTMQFHQLIRCQKWISKKKLSTFALPHRFWIVKFCNSVWNDYESPIILCPILLGLSFFLSFLKIISKRGLLYSQSIGVKFFTFSFNIVTVILSLSMFVWKKNWNFVSTIHCLPIQTIKIDFIIQYYCRFAHTKTRMHHHHYTQSTTHSSLK